jgi:uncharacterized protein YjiS (DUF1127 family)
MSVLNLLISAREAFIDWRRRKRAYAQLMMLDDHSLADIGLRRSQVRDLCEGYYASALPAAPVTTRDRVKFVSPKAV